MERITGVVLTFNNETTILGTMNSLKGVAHRIIVVDSGSTDRTLAIVSAFDCRVEHHPFSGYAAQRRYAFSLVRSGWILSLDADEEITPVLAREIRNICDNDLPEKSVSGYHIPILTLFQGRPLRFGGMYPDHHLRLFRVDDFSVQDLAVHEGMNVSGAVIELEGPILHRPYRDVHHMIEKMCSYSRLAAEQLYRDGKRGRSAVLMVLLRPMHSFFIKYFMRLGFLDGWRGLVYHICHSFYVFLKYTRLRELYDSIPTTPENPCNKA
ncbi:MAG: glycosyltransferase family 2 protein [Candidatus Wallbacteria bacterium HGW-Wallbacteria-1]|jgi:glycosyltransferase involved in cell wall biosynthesis|uniref:Glycosyltransferase family 2 protein n=1 Tax=Candidatus Wallbacteria bacterium HGW-Wallbacteria-1 TaxID=2013854 RepID=A0A2N1PUX6_9BACT|nr:MAG: glycosyltransferase family 2 protein [Candidatus Wallbacteria bacterium HGW-Wallbacteria-1]